MNEISDEKLTYWEKKYGLKNLVVAGYQAGYPMITFQKENNMSVVYMEQKAIDRVIRKAETFGGIELGVGYSLRRTSFLIVNDETIVICGHEYVIERVLNELF